MKKKVIVACGGAVATSTIAAEKIRELCKKKRDRHRDLPDPDLGDRIQPDGH